MTDQSKDRLYNLLPVVHRMRDAGPEFPLARFLRVISEQANLVEADIDQLYENWFIETCQDWVVPYIGDLIGYQVVHEAGQPVEVTEATSDVTRSQQASALQSLQHNKILIPRREVANTIAYRRRKGTLALLELLANSVAGWPARAVEFYRLLGLGQGSRRLRLERGRTVDLRQMAALDTIDGPFDALPHTTDLREIDARHSGRYNIPSVGLFVWRLKVYPVTQAPAYNLEQEGPNFFTFSTLSNDTPLFTKAEPESGPTDIADEMTVPGPIRRAGLDAQVDAYYGLDKSFYIWVGEGGKKPRTPVLPERIVAADLTDWHYQPHRGQIAVDPVLGRIAFHPREAPQYGLWVSYHYAFSADMGGGEYPRPISQPEGAVLYQVGETEEFKHISDAVVRWEQDSPSHAVIEIVDSGVYVEPITIHLNAGQTLQLRDGGPHPPGDPPAGLANRPPRRPVGEG